MVSLTISLGPFIKGAHTGPITLDDFASRRDTKSIVWVASQNFPQLRFNR